MYYCKTPLTEIMLTIILCILIIAIVAYAQLREGFRSCYDCDHRPLNKNGVTVLNPFIWPYSATECVDSLYLENTKVQAPKSPNVPDHAQ